MKLKKPNLLKIKKEIESLDGCEYCKQRQKEVMEHVKAGHK